MLAFARPQLGVEEEQRTERFEREFAAYVGTADAVAVGEAVGAIATRC
jgi:dTDP-4-amino-4,6-dideoxygalactose transaminase